MAITKGLGEGRSEPEDVEGQVPLFDLKSASVTKDIKFEMPMRLPNEEVILVISRDWYWTSDLENFDLKNKCVWF